MTLLIALLAVGCLLYFAQVAFIPVAIALFLSSLLTPAVDLLHRWHLPRGVGALEQLRRFGKREAKVRPAAESLLVATIAAPRTGASE